MLQVYIWGAGYYALQVIGEIDKTKACLLGIIDSDKKKQGKKLLHSIPIISPSDICGRKFDYLLISVRNYQVIESECKKLGIEDGKVISYWNEKNDHCIFRKRTESVEKLIKEKRTFQYRLDSAPYEWKIKPSPHIVSGAELLKKILKDHSSLCRFGDGEFEIIRGQERLWYQEPDHLLSERLKNVLHSKDNLINIAVAQNFVGLEQYKQNMADIIREYMYGDTRNYILELLDENRTYYDAYVTRPYIIYMDKKNADVIFPLFKEIWKERDIVIIEGELSRIGVGNDLMRDANSISRILCPSKNAWNKYETIFNYVLEKVSKESLICISLGPCATVLAHDLAREGYQALDIGQLDNEYEWYLRGVDERIKIQGKMVAEFTGNQKFELLDEEIYNSQILTKII